MGGSFAELECSRCGKRFKTGDKVNTIDEGTYDEQEEEITFDPYSGSYLCDDCWKLFKDGPVPSKRKSLLRRFHEWLDRPIYYSDKGDM